MSMFQIPEASPSTIINLRESAYATDLFITAVSRLDFFNRLDKEPADIDGICRIFDIKKRPADVMLTLFKAYGFLKEKAKKFYLTDMAKTYLLKESGFDLTSYVTSLKDRPACADIHGVLHTGKTANWATAKDSKDWAAAMEDDAFASSFTAGMNSRGAYLAAGVVKALDLTGYKKVLDIGGASGIYTAALLNAFPHLQGTVFEKPPVDKVAKYSLNKFGMRRRATVVAGDVFKDALPKGYDVHFISHVLHDWDFPECRTILKNSYQTLNPGGIIVLHDTHINKTKTGPVDIAEYSVLLTVLSEGKIYSVTEMKDLLEEAGFTEIQHKPTILNRSIITARKSR
jgi:3-hydroxy-5-methyl-1-naphthoate 3-O-methyltransferase